MGSPSVRLTQFSHGAGCGCKISPKALDEILSSAVKSLNVPGLLVGNETKDDAAVFEVADGLAIISTTDFFMPIVDDPVDFGRIAATNAISDVYAMGGRPIMAIAILGWPLDALSPALAKLVIDGGRLACNEAGIPLCGGHSIDAPEPIFGLAVTGTVKTDHVKKNSGGCPECQLYLTKPLGIGVLTTAEKKGILKPHHRGVATKVMCNLNAVGFDLGKMDEVRAMTDVTGFGLLGHLIEMCEGSGVSAKLNLRDIPVIDGVWEYIGVKCSPGGCRRNFESYGHKVRSSEGDPLGEDARLLLCDPQTSGGLLVAVQAGAQKQLEELLLAAGVGIHLIGELTEKREDGICVVVHEAPASE